MLNTCTEAHLAFGCFTTGFCLVAVVVAVVVLVVELTVFVVVFLVKILF